MLFNSDLIFKCCGLICFLLLYLSLGLLFWVCLLSFGFCMLSSVFSYCCADSWVVCLYVELWACCTICVADSGCLLVFTCIA